MPLNSYRQLKDSGTLCTEEAIYISIYSKTSAAEKSVKLTGKRQGSSFRVWGGKHKRNWLALILRRPAPVPERQGYVGENSHGELLGSLPSWHQRLPMLMTLQSHPASWNFIILAHIGASFQLGNLYSITAKDTNHQSTSEHA